MKTGNAREALIAEALGDLQHCITQLDEANKAARETTQALNQAAEVYKNRIDTMVNTLRTETADLILKTTQHAAQSLVSQQHASLQAAAQKAMTEVLKNDLQRKTKYTWLSGIFIGALTAGIVSVLISKIF